MPNRQRQSSQTMAALVARLRGGFPLADLDEMLAIPQSLVSQLPFDLSPRNVADSLSEVVVLNHALHIQRFNGDQIIPAYKVRGQCVAPIPAHVHDKGTSA